MPLISIARGRIPLYRQIERQLRDAIRLGRLGAGVRLPGVRTLAHELGVSRITVQVAYQQLAAEGLLERLTGSGSRVAGGAAVIGAGVSVDVRRPPRSPPTRPTDVRIDLRPGLVDRSLVPFEAWARHVRGAANDAASLGFAGSTDDSHGVASLRAAIASYVGVTRGVHATVDDVIVFSNLELACTAIARALVPAPGRIALEDPGDRRLRAAFTTSGAVIVGIPVDDGAADVQAIAGPVALAAVSPACQLPTGGNLAVERAAELLRWAADRDAVILEIDRYGHLPLAGRALPAVQGRDTEGRVVYVATFATYLYPGLPLAFAVVPRRLRERVATVAAAMDGGSPEIDELALARFIEDGELDRHIGRLRRVTAARHAALVEAIAESRTLTAPSGAGPLHLAARTAVKGVAASDLARAARSAGILVQPLSAFRFRPGLDDQIVLGYAHLDEASISDALATLARVARSLERSAAAKPA